MWVATKYGHLAQLFPSNMTSSLELCAERMASILDCFITVYIRVMLQFYSMIEVYPTVFRVLLT
jgi:hypothetical protein